MKIRKEMKNLFKTADIAFSEMDFNGKGFIEEDNFFHTMLNYKLPYSREEVQALFRKEKWFIRVPGGKMNYEIFTKTFFPQNVIGEETRDEGEEDKALETAPDDKAK